MTIDYYLSIGSLITGVITHSPMLQAVPTALRFTATCFPRLFPLGISKSYTCEEQLKLDNIKTLLTQIGPDLGIKNPNKINLRISNQLGANACMVGTINSIGGPLLCLGNLYFKNYQSELSKDSEYPEWVNLLNEISNTPLAIGKYIDECTIEKREKIKKLAKQFKDVLSQDELESILAHELGHAKHHHLLQFSGLLLMTLTANTLAQVFANTIGFGLIYSFASIPLVYLTIQAISRSHETEADGECVSATKYQQGMLKIHKKEMINQLFKKTSFAFENKVAEMLQETEWTSSHPNNAKRLQHVIQLSKEQPHPSTRMTHVAWSLTGLGILSLARSCCLDATAIWNARII